jgi:hypothetical protein
LPDLGKQSHVSAHKGLVFWVFSPPILTNPFFKFLFQRFWTDVVSFAFLSIFKP